MAIDHESRTPYSGNEIKELDMKFHSMFAFPKVFSELHNLSNSKVNFEIKMHIMTLLEEIVIQFENEDKGRAKKPIDILLGHFCQLQQVGGDLKEVTL